MNISTHRLLTSDLREIGGFFCVQKIFKKFWKNTPQKTLFHFKQVKGLNPNHENGSGIKSDIESRLMEGQVINRALKKLIKDNDLPDIVFHSFRHATNKVPLLMQKGFICFIVIS